MVSANFSLYFMTSPVGLKFSDPNDFQTHHFVSFHLNGGIVKLSKCAHEFLFLRFYIALAQTPADNRHLKIYPGPL